MKRWSSLAVLLLPLFAAADARVQVVGLFNGKALLAIDGAPPKTMIVGQTSPEGVRLISADSAQAVIEVSGKRQSLGMGQGVALAGHGRAEAVPESGGTAILYANADGHFFGEGSINGRGIKFLLDTGATSVSMSSAEARRLGIDYIMGKEGATSTAGGLVRAWRVSLNTVKVGGIVLSQVEGVVIDGDAPPFVLLGMSALNRMDMKRNGATMMLTKKY